MEVKKIELKPCPFCGGKADFKTKSNLSRHWEVGFDFTIKCSECDIEIPSTYRVTLILGRGGQLNEIIDERQKAMDDWNRRADDGLSYQRGER